MAAKLLEPIHTGEILHKNRFQNEPTVILSEAKDLLLYSRKADSSG